MELLDEELNLNELETFGFYELHFVAKSWMMSFHPVSPYSRKEVFVQFSPVDAFAGKKDAAT